MVSPPAPPKPAKQCRQSVKERKAGDPQSNEVEFAVPDGIIAHLARECGGNVHDRHVVDVVSGSFGKEPRGVNPQSGGHDHDPCCVAKNAADLDADSCFGSAHCNRREDTRHTRNNRVCYDFKERRTVPTHYTIRTNS
jgi:hypothetical protein